MQGTLLIFFVFVGVGIIVTNISIIVTLRNLKKKAENNKVLSDERYIELKLKLHYILTTLFGVGFLITFMGWNIKSEIASELKSEVTSEIETLLSIYVVPDLRIVQEEPIRFYYKDLQPINAKNLPHFKQPPIVNFQQTESSVTLYITELTKDFVEFTTASNFWDEADKKRGINITLWIVER